MGTPRFAAEILDELAEFHEIVAVYTRPDAVRGREGARASPVKEVAERRGFPCAPRTLRMRTMQAELAALKPDVICVRPTGPFFPRKCDLPHYGCLNVHGLLLPLARGPHRAGPSSPATRRRRVHHGHGGGARHRRLLRVPLALPGRFAHSRRAHRAGSSGRQRCSRRWPRPRAAICAGWPRTRRWSPRREDRQRRAEPRSAESAIVNNRRVRASGGAHPARTVVLAGR